MQAYAQHLFTHGYVILPTAYEGNLRQDLEQEFYNAPEFKKKLRFVNSLLWIICSRLRYFLIVEFH